MDKVSVFAPASIGNIGPAFDNLGLAVDAAGDVVTVRKKKGVSIAIDLITGIGSVPLDPEKNAASIAAKAVMDRLGLRIGLRIKIKKGIPAGSGLGSSAASAVAAGYATNVLLGNILSKDDLVYPITIAEKEVSGEFFCDNTASSLMGGVILTRSYEELEVIRLGSLAKAHFAIVKPHMEVLTRAAREILPTEIPLRNFVKNNANSCGIVASVYTQDIRLFGRCIDDRAIEPYRAKLIPGFENVKASALDAGALGCAISGAGPAIFAVCEDHQICDRVIVAMQDAFSSAGLASDSYCARMDNAGARVVEDSI